MSKIALKPSSAGESYQRDFHGWARSQMRALAARDHVRLDVAGLIEEVEALGRSQRHAIRSHLEVLVAHLLKFRMQPERATPSWRRTPRNQRREIARLIARSPSLRSVPGDVLGDVYGDAVRIAADETGIEARSFPSDCPFSLDQVLDPRFEAE